MNAYTAVCRNAALALDYGHKAAISVLASLCNDLGFKLALAFVPRNSKAAPELDADTRKALGIDGIEVKTAAPDELADGFVAAQLMLVQVINSPDPQQYGKRNEWAIKYLRDAKALAENIVDWSARSTIKQKEAEAAKFALVGTKVNLDDIKKAIIAEKQATTSVILEQVNGELTRSYQMLKGKSTEELWSVIEATYEAAGEVMASRVNQSIAAIIDAQAKRFSTNAGYTTLDDGIVALKLALTPTPAARA